MELQEVIECAKKYVKCQSHIFEECLEKECEECEFDTFLAADEFITIFLPIVEKQIPKKPFHITDNIAHCKVCGTMVLGRDKFCDEYCTHCGQAIDWSDSE